MYIGKQVEIDLELGKLSINLTKKHTDDTVNFDEEDNLQHG